MLQSPHPLYTHLEMVLLVDDGTETILRQSSFTSYLDGKWVSNHRLFLKIILIT